MKSTALFLLLLAGYGTIYGKGYLRTLEGQKDKPNILFIVSEDNGPELSCYGAPAQTRVLDGLARRGVRFQRAYVPQAGCSPSRASFLTGLYPHQNGQIGLATWKYGMYNPHTPNLVNSLKASGYRTGIIGKIHVNPEDAFDFDFHTIKEANFKRTGLDRYAKAAAEFMRGGEEPFYLQVNYPDAHDPFLAQVDGLPEKVLTGKDVETLPYHGVTSDELKQKVADYYNSIMRLDALVGVLLDSLRAVGKYENTLIVYIGDHGADMLRGKRTSYEGGTRIPMIISWPGSGRTGRVYEGLVSTIDLFPTFMEVSGNPIPSHLPGCSLAGVIRGSDRPIRERLFTEYNVHSNHNPYPQRAVRDGRFKLIHNLVAGYENPGYAYTNGLYPSADSAIAAAPEKIAAAYQRMKRPPEFELYDLVEDPYEWNNLSGDPRYEREAATLREALLEWQRNTRDPFLDPSVAERFFLEVMETGNKKLDLRYHDYMYPDIAFNNDPK